MPTPQLRSLSLEWLKVETSLVLFFAMKYWCPEYGSISCLCALGIPAVPEEH